jgi:hypothetical protein
MYTTKQLPSAAMETLKQFSDKHISMETHGQQYSTTIYIIIFELDHTTDRPKLEYVCLEFHYIYEFQQAGKQLAEVRRVLFPHVHYSHAYTIDYLELHTLHNRRYYGNALFLIRSYVGSKLCHSVLETWFSSHFMVNQRLSVFRVGSLSKNWLGRFTSSANVCRDIAVFGT